MATEPSKVIATEELKKSSDNTTSIVDNTKTTASAQPIFGAIQANTSGHVVGNPTAQPAKPEVKSGVDQLEIDKNRKIFEEYAAKQKGFVAPEAKIAFDDDAEKNPDQVEVHIDVEYNGHRYHFESMKLKHLDVIYNNLHSQAKVREKFADTKTRDRAQTETQVTDLTYRFKRKDKDNQPKAPNPFSGFVVTDAETDKFLGMSILGGSTISGASEMARLNAVDAWSHAPEEIVKEYAPDSIKPKSNAEPAYKGLGTAEVCTMLQYGAFLKKNGYQVLGKPLEAVVATARVDNPGSWMSNAKAGMTLREPFVDVNANFGPQLRFQLRKAIP
jgi:hypothetical protein